jgi:uncharacterized protein (DUF736 family)
MVAARSLSLLRPQHSGGPEGAGFLKRSIALTQRIKIVVGWSKTRKTSGKEYVTLSSDASEFDSNKFCDTQEDCTSFEKEKHKFVTRNLEADINTSKPS